MKKIMKSILFFAVVLIAIQSCAKQEIFETKEEALGRYVYEFSLAQEDDVKALLGDDSIEYEAADGLGVFGAGLVNAPSGVNITANPVTVTVTATSALTAGNKLYAYYPYSVDNATAKVSAVNLEIPTTQTQRSKTFDADAMPMVSLPFVVAKNLPIKTKEPVGQIYMANLGAVIEFNVFGASFTSEKIESVSFVAESALAGTFKFNLSTVKDESSLSLPTLSQTTVKTVLGQAIAVGKTKASAAKLYMVVAPGTHKGVVELCTDKARYYYYVDTAIAFNRSKVRPLNLDLANAQRTKIDFSTILRINGYNADNYRPLELNLSNFGYYDSSKNLPSVKNTTATNSKNFVATQVFSKKEIPNGSLILVLDGYQYRPEAWVNANTLNNASGSNLSRPTNTSVSITQVNDEWWGDFTLRGFNLSASPNVALNADASVLEGVRSSFAIMVPKADYASASLEEILVAEGYNPQNYKKLSISYTDFAYYNSQNNSTLYTVENSGWGSTIDDFVATPIYTKSNLPNGTLLVQRAGYMYRPEGWVSLDSTNGKNGTSGVLRPDNVTTSLVEVNDAWWGTFKYRAFNLAFADRTPLATSATATQTLCPQVRAAFGIYVPKKKSASALTTLIKSAGYNPDDYVQLDVPFTNFAYYQSDQTDYVSTLRTVAMDGWNNTIKDFVATPIYTRADLPAGTLIVQKSGNMYRAEGWTDLNIPNGSSGSGITRPANVTASVVKIDNDWWGSFQYRGFNLAYEDRTDLAAGADASETLCRSLSDGFGIFVPKNAKLMGPTETADDLSATPSSSVGLDYKKIESAPHPRLILTKADFEALKSTVNSNAITKKFHDFIITTANSACGYSNLKYVKSGKTIMNVCRNAITRIMFCAYAFRMTGELKYLTSAERDIVTVCGFPDWNPDHYLDVGEMATAVAFGLDWLYDELKPETRDLARKALNDYLFVTSKDSKYNAWAHLSHNKNQICNAAIIVSAIASYEKDKKNAVEMLESAITSNKTYGFQQYGLSNESHTGGCYLEGYMYWGYGTTYQVISIAALEKIFGNSGGLYEANPSFAASAEWMLHMVGPSYKPFNFSDCDDDEDGMLPMWWFANKLNDPSLLVHEIRLAKRDDWGFGERRLLPLIFGFMDMQHLKASTPKPSKNLWYSTDGDSELGRACVLMHTDWTMSETDKFLGLIGGRPNVSHGHMDGASFVYDALGQRWAMDLGRQAYSDTEAYIGSELWDVGKNSLRWTVYRLGNLGHNIPHVVNNGHGGLYNSNGKAFMDATFFDRNPGKLGCKYTYYGINWEGTAENQDIATKGAIRYAEFINQNKDMAISDDLTANTGKSPLIRWQFATPATATAVNKSGVQYFKLVQAGKTLYVSIKIKDFIPGNGTDAAPSLTLKTWEAKGDKEYDAANPGVTMCGYDVQLKSDDRIKLTATFTETLPQ